MARVLSFARLAAMLAVLYVAGAILGLGLLVAAFRLGVLSGIDILFYRGLVLVALAALATFAIVALVLARWSPALGLRDAFTAAVLSLSLNLSFLVLVPVTVDRSISVFMLAEMADGREAITPDEATRIFKSVYVDEHRQIDRRLREQAASGNIAKEGDAYRITRRGILVVGAARYVAWLFDSRAGLVAPRAASPHGALAVRR